MDELAHELDALRDDFAPHWDEARSQELFVGVGQLRRRRQVQRVTGSTAAMVAACALAVMVWRGFDRHGQPISPAAPAQLARVSASIKAMQPSAAVIAALPGAAATQSHVGPGQTLRLADGSFVQVAVGVGVGAIDVINNRGMQVDLRLVSGAAHFDVVPNHERHFVVDAGPVQVAVLGTVFDVERSEGRVRVAVTEGKVRVTAADGLHMVSAGEASWFDEGGAQAQAQARTNDDEAAFAEHAVLHAEHPEHGKRVHKEVAVHVAWRSLSQAGDYEAAYRALSQGSHVDDDPAALMDAADAARLSGHPDAAVGYLRRVARDHRASPVAPLAAFTLGRVLLERLGQPSEAAESFASARSLAPSGSLAQDALAREVEALSKAGNAHEAYLRAQQYVQTYPNGRRLHAVRLYGGLE